MNDENDSISHLCDGVDPDGPGEITQNQEAEAVNHAR